MIPRAFAVVKRQRALDPGAHPAGVGMIMHILAVFGDEKVARAWCENANEWYGDMHPLTPLEVVGDILDEPRLFPVEAMRGKS